MKLLENNKLIGLVVIFLILTACTGHPVKFDLFEAQPDRSQVDFTQGRLISASASGFQMLLFFPIGINERHEDAYRLLYQQLQNEYIDEIKIKESWTYAFVGTIYTTTLEAIAYPIKSS